MARVPTPVLDIGHNTHVSPERKGNPERFLYFQSFAFKSRLTTLSSSFRSLGLPRVVPIIAPHTSSGPEPVLAAVDHSRGASQVATHTSAHSKPNGKVCWASRDSNPGPRDYVLIRSENSLPYSTFQPPTRNDGLIRCDWICTVLTMELLQFYYYSRKIGHRTSVHFWLPTKCKNCFCSTIFHRFRLTNILHSRQDAAPETP